MKNFQQLTSTIEQIHHNLQCQAINAVNQALTIRNWLTGYYIVEFEQEGEDRAAYGMKLISKLATTLNHIKGFDERSLRKFRQFYIQYTYLKEYILTSQKRGTVSPIFNLPEIRGTVSPVLENPEEKKAIITSEKTNHVPAEKIISRLSYSHIELLLNIENSLKRTFYEVECIRATWSVRELKRQIASLYYERSSLSGKPEKLSELVRSNATFKENGDIIKNIYAFEFLNLNIKEAVEESDLESALLDHLQDFIIEMGRGFCFEGRQKRILIGETYYFIDLVFYHRILKCHVLIDLKIGAFEHGDIGQLNTYLNYYTEEIKEKDDQPPVGILLVAEKDQALVKYATAGMDQNLFVQQYLIQLPDIAQLKSYIEEELKKLL